MDVDLWTGFLTKESTFLCRFLQFEKCPNNDRFLNSFIEYYIKICYNTVNTIDQLTIQPIMFFIVKSKSYSYIVYIIN